MLPINLLVVNSCIHTNNENNTYKSVVFGRFEGCVPKSWKVSKVNGIDTIRWLILTEINDSIYVEYGPYTPIFNHYIRVRPMSHKAYLDSLNKEYPENMVFSENSEADEGQGIYLKEYYFYDKIDNCKVKIGFPKKLGQGLSLAYFSNFYNENDLGIYSKNIDSLTQIDFKKFIYSIKKKTL